MSLILKNYSEEILAGQKIITGFEAHELDLKTKEFFLKIKPGGLILFKRNIKNKNQLKKLVSDILDFFEKNNIPKPFISIDQEGGIVSRLKEPDFKELPSIETVLSHEQSKEHAFEMCEILKELHINMNMAPVLDVSDLNKNSIMKKRTFKGSPKQVADLGKIMIKAYMEKGIIPVGKHFPGIGNTTLDSHEVLPEYNEEIEFIKNNDILPFNEAIRAGIPCLMFSHILYTKIDNFWPASLSKEICRKILRKELGFDGIAMTDDLDMNAVKSDFQTCAKQMLKADLDIALICNTFDKTFKVHSVFMEEIKNLNKEIFISIERIFKIKNRFFA
ncbi:MAG: glycoside hydrolase family 3 N-terminal domain-containing protein [Desulforegulaceae bacterium]|nr:glycoside hydrolase family 3 N-terminal domain-containing protein [Desulforegulaceae bacterium]